VAGGLLLVPLESFFQLRPAAEHRGTVIAAANFAAFVGMMVAGLADFGLCEALTASQRFGLVGVLSLLVGLWLYRTLPEEEVS
jgi:acyl-[acyl-carrier-protein]-phospholipid O-acyltransferase/long-chain-fatty-acid--[acyl-carrier-protein] ligase